MAGDADNTAIWEGADVFVAPLGSELPATIEDDFPAEWTAVGLLDGEAGTTSARTEDVTDFNAWGVGSFREGRRNFKETRTFVAWERNPVTDELENPGSTASAVYVPVPGRQLIAFEYRDTETGGVRREISFYQAQVVRSGDTTINDAAPESIPFIATIYADPTTKQLWVRQSTQDLAETGS